MRVKNFARAARRPGFSLIELLVVIGILGISVLAAIPAITHSTATRQLDGAADDFRSAFQLAKWQAASLKQSHRIRFVSQTDDWMIYLERESASGTWTAAKGWRAKSVSKRFTITMNLPTDLTIVFQPTGFVSNYDGTRNTITIVSSKLVSLSQPATRTLRILGGGSVQYIKS